MGFGNQIKVAPLAADAAHRQEALPPEDLRAATRAGRRDSPLARLGHDCLHLHPVTVSGLVLVGVLLYYVRACGSIAGTIPALGQYGPVADYVWFYYQAGQQALQTRAPITGFVYSLFFAICMVPFAQLPLYASLWIWLGVEILITLGLFLVPTFHFYRTYRPAYFLYLLIFLTSVPILDNLKWGQPSSLLVLGLLGCLYLYRNHHDRSAALALAFVTSIKFYPGFFLVYFLLRRDYRFVVFFVIFTGLFLVGLPVLLTDTGWWVGYHYNLYDNLNTLRIAVRHMANSQYLPYVVFRLHGGVLHDLSQIELPRRVCLAIVAINLLIVNRLARHRSRAESSGWSFLLLFGCMPLLVESSWPHYFGWLPFCQAFLALSFAGHRINAVNLAKVLLLLAPSILLSSMMCLNWVGGWQPMHRYGLILLSSILMMVLTWLQMPSIRLRGYQERSGIWIAMGQEFQ